MVKTERQRYILFQIFKKEAFQLTQYDILKALWQSIWRYFGLKEANKIGLWLLELDDRYGIIRCSDNTKEIIITSLSFVKEVKGKKLILSPIKTSGTVKTLKKFKKLRDEEVFRKK